MKQLLLYGRFRDGGSSEWKDEEGKRYWLDRGFNHKKEILYYMKDIQI